MSPSLVLHDVRGYGRLLVDATVGVTDVVEGMHQGIARPWAPRSGRGRTGGITGLVYGSIRATAGLVGGTLDSALAAAIVAGEASGAIGASGDGPATAGRDTARAVVNGLVGDHLAATGNPLAIPMTLRRSERVDPSPRSLAGDAITAPARRAIVFLHGLCQSDACWRRDGDDSAAALARELGARAISLHYNSGLHVSVNGQAFARMLEALLAAWPVAIEELTIVGYSMGGLVARSACHYAAAEGLHWPSRLRRLVFLGTPHHGAPLERGGNWLQAAVGAIPWTAAMARLGRLRSAGITDLRHGNLVHEDWNDADRFAHHTDRRRHVPLPPGVDCFAIAGLLGTGRSPITARTVGDGLVPVPSALGVHPDPRRTLALAPSHCAILEATGHLGLLHGREVHERLRGWLAS